MADAVLDTLPQNARVDRTRLERDLCRESFYDFFLRFWPTLVAEELTDNWHIKYLCDELQTMAERVFRRQPKEHDLIINVSPGSTKSTICSEMFPAWLWARESSLRTIAGSYAYGLSLFLAAQTRRIVTSAKYRELFPEVELSSEGKEMLETARGGQRIATSTGGRITGLHAHFIIIDDPLNPKEAMSDVMLAGANEWFDQTLMSRMVNKAVTPVILVMQRLHQNDPTGHMLERTAAGVPVRHICLPAEFDSNIKPRNLRLHYKLRDGLFDPVRLPRTVLDRTRVELLDYGYAGQYMQRPIPKGGGMFRTDMIQMRPVAPHPKLFRQLVRAWDKAGTPQGGAYTVGCLMGEDRDGRFWILDVIRGQWEAAERERIIKQTAMRDGRLVKIVVEQEGGSGGKESATATLRMLAGYRVKLDRPVGDKVTRAEPLAVQVNGGNVVMVTGVTGSAAWVGPFLAEMGFFPHSTYKDQVDAAGLAFAAMTAVRFRAGGLGGIKPRRPGKR